MKKLLLTILTAILSLANAHAQVTDGYLTSGDIVTVGNDNWGNGWRYLEANPTNGLQTIDYVTQNCLWQIGITRTNHEYD